MSNKRYEKRLLRILPVVISATIALSIAGLSTVAYADDAPLDDPSQSTIVLDATETPTQDDTTSAPTAPETPAPASTVETPAPEPTTPAAENQDPAPSVDAPATEDTAQTEAPAADQTDAAATQEADSPTEPAAIDETPEATAPAQDDELATQSDNEGTARSIADGLYKITPVASTKTSVAVKGGSANNDAEVVTASPANVDYQKFFIEYDESVGYYRIHVMSSGKDVVANSANKIVQSDDATTMPLWEIFEAARNATSVSYAFRNRDTGLLMTLSGTNLVASAGDPSQNKSQRFLLTTLDVLTNGIYNITPKTNASYAVTVMSNAAYDTEKIDLEAKNNSTGQKFQVEKVSDGIYRIRTAASGGWLTDTGTAADRTSFVGQVGTSATAVNDANSWQVCWNGTSWSLRNVATGRILSLHSIEAGKRLRTYAAGDGDVQHFNFVSTTLVNNGTYFIDSALSSKVLTINKSSIANGGNVIVAAKSKYNNQKFNITKSGNYYYVTNVLSGKALQVDSSSKSNGANVVQWDNKSLASQQWDIRIGDHGTLVFVNVNSGLALNVSSGDGKNVNQGKLTGTTRQGWTLIPTTYTGWYRVKNHWRYKSTNSKASYEKDINSKGKSLKHYDVMYDIWKKIKKKKSKTKYLVASSWDSCYVVVFEGKKGKWAPLKGFNCGNGSAAVIESKVRAKNPGSTWKWNPVWDRYLATKNTRGNIPELPPQDRWAAKLGTTWKTSRVKRVNAHEKWFTSISWTLGYHTYLNSKKELGRHLSNGCTRLSYANAKWIYKNIGVGTRCCQIRTKAYTK